jgi:hypothetical protein
MRNRAFVTIALALAVGLAAAASPFASTSPDGLNRVAADQGFEQKGRAHDDSPLPGYAFPGIRDEHLAKGIAGFTGTVMVFAAGFGVASVLRRRGVPARASARSRRPAWPETPPASCTDSTRARSCSRSPA